MRMNNTNANTNTNTTATANGICIATTALVFALLSSANAWVAPTTIQSQINTPPTSTSTSTSAASVLPRHYPRTILRATIEDQEEEQRNAKPAPRRTRRIDDILNEYEATGNAGLTISVLESSLKKEQEKASTLAIRLARAEQIINEQNNRLNVERSSLQQKSQALFETQKKLKELEQRLSTSRNGQQARAQTQLPPPQSQVETPWQHPPLLTNERQYPLITNWVMNPNTGEVTGSVTCHPSIPDGTTIVTSGLNRESFAMAGDSFVYHADKPATVVKTQSGSMYQLGVKKIRFQPSGPTPAELQQQQQAQERKRLKLQEQINPNISLDVPLTGESISNGRGTKYLLAGEVKRKPSGRSEIVLAYKCDDSLRVCDSVTPYVIKLSTRKDKLRREYESYCQLQEKTASGGWIGGALSMFDQPGGSSKEEPFVTCYDFLPSCEGSIKYAQHSALVMEKGHEDLRDYEFHLVQDANVDSEYPPGTIAATMEPEVIMASLMVAAQCIDVLHSRARLVWTDLKAENLIFMEPQEREDDGNIERVVSIKGIDLESAIPHRGHPLDYTPEACPPEFAKFHLKGKAYDFVLDYSYDVWSFGMLAFELVTGSAYFRGKAPTEIMAILGSADFSPPLSSPNDDYLVEDPLLRELIRSCLKVDPRSRISVRNILRHRYFQQSQQQQQQHQRQQQQQPFGNQGDGSDGGTFW